MASATFEAPAAPPAGVFSERNMRWYLGGQLVSLTGSLLQSAVLSLLIIKIVGRDGAALWVGTVGALNLAPGAILGPFAGLLLDGYSKKGILIMTGILGAAQSATLALLVFENRITIGEIIALAALMGFVNAIDGPGRNAIVKDAVLDPRNVRAASKWFTSLYNIAMLAGPGCAGYLVLTVGYGGTFVLNCLSFVVLVVALLKMRMVACHGNGLAVARWVSTANRGMGYVLGNPGIRLCVLLSSVVTGCGFSYYALLAVIARDMFGGGPIVYSRLAASSGAGTLLGSFIVIVFDRHCSHRTFLAAGTGILGGSLLALSRTGSVPVALVLIFVIGASVMVSFSTLRSSITHLSDPKLMGIVMGVAFSFFYGSMTVGYFGGGYVANRWGCPFEIALCGTILIVTAAAIPFLPGVGALDAKH